LLSEVAVEQAILQLRKKQDRRVRLGHPWVYSNEIDTDATPLSALQPGVPVDLLAPNGEWLGRGYANPHSLICVRLLTRRQGQQIDRRMLVERVERALALRERIYPDPYYRLLFGESDGVPGLVVDRYGEYLVGQFTTAGMEALREQVVEALLQVLRPAGILLRNDSAARDLEGLSQAVEPVFGSVPELVEIAEAGGRFQVQPHTGQKTGWFYDQADNRTRLSRYARDARLLDVFCYQGGWGIRGLLAGARQASFVDASQPALDQVQRNAELNGVADRIETLRGDAFAQLKQLRHSDRRFDLVVTDPPAFIKRRKDLNEGLKAYHRLAEAALALVEPGGVVVSASCSFHLSQEQLLEVNYAAARRLGLGLQLLERGSQGPDHPLHPLLPETGYLKALYLRVLPAD